jgi:uncharacterized protein (TIGR03067 family)
LAVLAGCVLLPALAFAAEPPQKPAAPADEELLQGTWVVVSFEKDGRKHPDPGKGRVVIRKSELSIGQEGEAGDTFTFKLHPTEKPKGIDLKMPGEKTPTLGIYRLEGDRLTLCVRGRGDRKKDGTPSDLRESSRPKEFATEGNMLMVLTRKKP